MIKYARTSDPRSGSRHGAVKRPILSAAGVVCVFAGAVATAGATDLTLNDAALMSLDWHRYEGGIPPPHPIVVLAKRDVPGPGVEFDIRFPTVPLGQDTTLHYLSSNQGGTGCLVGEIGGALDEYASKFTFVAVDGRIPAFPFNYGIWVGTPFNLAFGNVALAPGFSKTSRTSIAGVTNISSIGFNIFRATPQHWNTAGNTVTLRVQAVEVVAIGDGPIEDCNGNDLRDACEHGDSDGDGSITLLDFAAFQTCFTGADRPDIAACCSVFDFENDNDIDLEDYVRLFAGP